MAILIDTSILIAYERGQLDIAGHVAGREAEEVFLSVISASELLHRNDAEITYLIPGLFARVSKANEVSYFSAVP
ncbi:MAG: type II toxin-antitoxin system VapC family toxin [Chloroflexi bacterium]|nr:type II toxin-antitoxin system VapC family toxin [Chloroflexota bacterium]